MKRLVLGMLIVAGAAAPGAGQEALLPGTGGGVGLTVAGWGFSKAVAQSGGGLQAVTQVANDPRIASDPRGAVRDAVTSAVRSNLPGLLSPVLGAGRTMRGAGASAGRWVRRGNRIIVYGV